ncbi:MAG: WG repeat-containing protein [Oscillospiraceae bacterium]|nr:WG repeat-containing protein [Oscillospiraceae bacterium]
MGDGRRYEKEKTQLNIKKVGVFILAVLVIIMIIVSLQKILSKTNNNLSSTGSNVEYFSVYTNGKWGVIDSNGNTVIDPTYNEMIIVPDSQKPVFLCVYNVDLNDETYETKVLNQNNQEILTGYDKVELLDNYDENYNIWQEKNILKVEKNGKYGIVNYDGKVLLSLEYDDIQTLKGASNNITIVKDGKMGLCNGLGEIIIDPQYKKILPLGDNAQNGYIVVDSNNKYGIVGTNKKVTIEPKYTDIKEESGANQYIVKDGNWELINNQNEVLLNSNGAFDDIIAVNGNNVIVKQNNKYGVVDINGKIEIPCQYDYLGYTFENYYIAEKSNKYGLIDLGNNTKIKFNYVSMYYRNDADIIEAGNSNNTTDVYDNGLNKKVTGVVSEVNVDDGYIKIWNGTDYQYYNFKFEPKQNNEVLSGKTLYLSKKDGKYGYINKSGDVVVDYIYDDATEQNAYGFAAVKKDGLWGSINKMGVVVAQPQYNLDINPIVDFIGKWYLGKDLNLNYYTDEK